MNLDSNESAETTSQEEDKALEKEEKRKKSKTQNERTVQKGARQLVVSGLCDANPCALISVQTPVRSRWKVRA